MVKKTGFRVQFWPTPSFAKKKEEYFINNFLCCCCFSTMPMAIEKY
jgi:hypothetical protein